MAPCKVCNCTREVIQFTAKSKLSLSFMLLLVSSTLAQLDWKSSCEGNQIRNGSILDRNLNVVLNSLVENVAETGYNISWYGENGDKMYGLAQCRGDANASICWACISQASNNLREKCSASSGSVHMSVRISACFLRYATHNFYSKLDTSSNLGCENFTSTTDANSRVLNWSIASLLTRLMEKVVSSNVGYSTLSEDGVYSLSQCYRDLDMDQCQECLNRVYQLLASCWRLSKEGEVMLENCMIRYATHQFYGNAVLLPSPPSGSVPSKIQEGKSRPRLALILGLTIAGVVILVLLPVVVVIWKRKAIKPAYLGHHKPSSEYSTAISKSKLNYEYQTLQISTKNFCVTNKLGEGGFGSVYKGVLPHGREIAVKKLFANGKQSVCEFFNEVNLISRVQHKNLVKLLGFSVHGTDRLLVYELLPNKSLDLFLFDENTDNVLNWQRRFEIILGTAGGLAYLHQESDIRIIHRDIKTSNILLDQHFKPKIADFGLVRHFAEDQTHLNTTIVGTRGYMAPEYLVHGHLTEKVDVYAFGVVIFEIICGRKNKTPIYANDMPSLLTEVWNHYLSGTISNIIDDKIKVEENYEEEILQVVHVALLCTQASARLRPSMSKVIMFLTSKDPNLPVPTEPPYIEFNQSQSLPNTDVAPGYETYNTPSNIASSLATPLSPMSPNTISLSSFGGR